MNKRLLISLILFYAFWPLMAGAADCDLGLSPSDVWFSKKEFFAGEKVKIYAQTRNSGDKDLSAYVIFYHNQVAIGEPQPISVVSGGTEDAVWVDWLAESGLGEIVVRIVGQTPADSISDNDSVMVAINIDNDNDNDGVGDGEDLDDDNDDLSDIEEANQKTNPLNPDTDNDGVVDSRDEEPLDSTKSVKEKPKAPPTPKKSVAGLLNPPLRPKIASLPAASAATGDDIPYFEFESERQVKIKESVAGGSAEDREPVEEAAPANTESPAKKIHFSKNQWLIFIFLFAVLAYFLPLVFRLNKRNKKR